ncbi:ABC transporter permease [Candidatus Leptofilum sp.]|uniref:ABC transporter permease n=1 Tax=Candidatus Leptofilum sp. TaxID=3241576 RepID=UPI003B5B4068
MGGLNREYVLKRLGMFLLTVWLGATIIFIVPRLAPGDPVTATIGRMISQGGSVENADAMIEAWRERFGLDAPVHIQYIRYLGNLATFNTGPSLAFFPAEVDDLVARAAPWTLGLLLIATLFSFIIGNVVGALIAWRPTPRWIRRLLPLTITFTAIPPFMLGILLIFLFAFQLEWLPFTGAYGRGITPGWNLEFIGSAIQHGILPALAIVLTSMGFWALGMRGMMITMDGQDYMVLAEAKGLRSSRIFMWYGIRNGILPQMTALALTLGSIAAGSVIVEVIFTYPGMGFLLYQGILNSDFNLIQGIVFYLILGVSLAVLIIDLLYPLIDPRITYERS